VSVRLAFHGAARTVTGSRYLLTVDGPGGASRTLVDAGLFQGLEELRLLNWRPPPFPPRQVDRVLLTHAHIDHSGVLPRLVKEGLRCPIHCTTATYELARLLLVDSAKLHEEDAEYANRKGYSKHRPALPLYTVAAAERALELFETVELGADLDLGDGLRARFHNAGHILGAASISLEIEPAAGRTGGRIVWSGDVGRYDVPLHLDPDPIPACDVLICESTYGDRAHDPTPVEEQLLEPLLDTFERNGTVLIPAFAVGRSQLITFVLRELMESGRLPEVPVHIDSPMAVDATSIYSRHLDEHHLDPEVFADGRSRLFPGKVSLHRSVAQSKRLNDMRGPRIIVSASGMLSGGRVLHHLRRLVSDRRNLVILAGYQAAGTRGRKLLEGAPTIRMHGMDVAVRAQVMALHGLSAHADADELVRWLRSGEAAPRQVFLTHGEPEAAYAFAQRVRRELGFRTSVPELDEEAELDQLLAAT
jgi:metallo-beta-lactamase family protein